MKQQAITAESIKFEQEINRVFMVYAEFKYYIVLLILARMRRDGKDYACYEAAEAEVDVVGSNLWSYWNESAVTPKQAFNKLFK